MRKRFVFSAILTCSFLMNNQIHADDIHGFENISIVKEPVITERKCCETNLDEEGNALDSLFLSLVKEGCDLCRDLIFACENEFFDLADEKQFIELIKGLSSGQRFLQACGDLFTCLNISEEEVSEDIFSYETLLQRLEELQHLWRSYQQNSQHLENVRRELDIRERELEFKKDLLAWQKEKLNKELSWKRESQTRDELY